MKPQKVGWWLAGFVAIVLLCNGTLWVWTRPSRITVPPRQYPSPNAYEAYKNLAESMKNDLETDARFRKAEMAVLDAGGQASAQEKAYYIKRMRPYLDAYRACLEMPSVAVFENDYLWLMPELAQFRRIAWAEAFLMREALRAGRVDEASQRAADVMRFAEQTRNEGGLMHYLMGYTMIRIGLAPLQEALPQIQDTRVLERIMQLARDYETRRMPFAKAMQTEYYLGLAFYRDLAERRIKPSDLREIMEFYQLSGGGSWEEALVLEGVGIPFVFGSSLKEYEEYHAQVRADLAQPMWKRTLAQPPIKRFLNTLIAPQPLQMGKDEQCEVALVRLLGCAAAIKLFKQRTGRYPNTLSDLNLGDIATDPFTGKPFIYRHDPKKGFQLYSVGVNRVDDGGRITDHDLNGGDITPALPPPSQRPKAHGVLSAPVWIR